MRPFDLKKALAGEPVVTRDGRRVTQLIHFQIDGIMKDDTPYPIYGVVDYRMIDAWTIKGEAHQDARVSDADLFMAGTKHRGVIEIWRCGNLYSSEITFNADRSLTKLGYTQASGMTLVHTQAIEWEE